MVMSLWPTFLALPVYIIALRKWAHYHVRYVIHCESNIFMPSGFRMADNFLPQLFLHAYYVFIYVQNYENLFRPNYL